MLPPLSARMGADRNWIRAMNMDSPPALSDGSSEAVAADIAATVAAAAAAEADRATKAAVETAAAVEAAARTVADAAATAAAAVADVVEAKAALVAAAAAAAAEARRIETRLRHDALHDQLTGLPNRRLLLDRLIQALARSARSGGSVAVIFVDLDGFKAVNDTLGHAAGDALLVGVAGRLLSCLRETDTCARVGGDEFAIVCEGIDLPVDGPKLVERLTEALHAGVPLGDGNHRVAASFGTAVSSPGSLPLDLLAAADEAMYEMKATRGQAAPSVRLG